LAAAFQDRGFTIRQNPTPKATSSTRAITSPYGNVSPSALLAKNATLVFDITLNSLQ